MLVLGRGIISEAAWMMIAENPKPSTLNPEPRT